jgi:HIP---CoA ligase
MSSEIAHSEITLGRTIPQVIMQAAAKFGDKPAIVEGEKRISYRELSALAMRSAAAFHHAGLRPGERVSIWAPNGLDWIVAALGVQAAGGCIVPLNTRFKGIEAGYILGRAQSRFLVVTAKFLGETYKDKIAGQDLPHLERILTIPSAELQEGDWEAFLAAATLEDEAAVRALQEKFTGDEISDIMFTSGTTGYPKGVVTNHAQNVRVYAEWGRWMSLGEDDRYLIVYPFFHCSGYKSGWLACFIAGATAYPLAMLDVKALGQLVEEQKITFLPGPPTLFQTLLSAPAAERGDLSSIRVANTGASAVPPASIGRMRTELGFQSVMTGYGLTETCGTVTLSDFNDGPEIVAKYCGKALPGVEMRIVDADNNEVPLEEAGEVVVRGYNVMQGYFDDEAATAKAIDEDGWLHTGDIGILNADGYLRLTDRKNDMFIVGGFNCYPAEIERIMCGNPAYAQVAVIGVPDERLGEVGKAYVVPRAGEAVTPESVIKWAREAMANYKVPRYVEVVDALPMNAVGKVQKFILREDGK